MAHKTYLVSILKSIFTVKTHKTVLKSQPVFSCLCDQDILNPAMPVQALQEI